MSSPVDQIDAARLEELTQREQETFEARHPKSKAWHEEEASALFKAVPMTWMSEWVGGFPVVAAEAAGAHLTDIDGNEYVDFCMGDTGATAGHAPAETVAAINAQLTRGLTLMLPTEDGPYVARELAARFGVPKWQFTLAATEANRIALRFCRGLTGRPKMLAFNHTYHGSVDDTLAQLDGGGKVESYPTSYGPPRDPAATTRLVDFNDLEALEREFAQGDVACVLGEPVLTGSGIVWPQPGFHAEMRRLCTEYGVLLIIDETHTLCTGPGGYVAEAGLEPDLVTMGKFIAGGVPIGALGMSAEVAERGEALDPGQLGALGGIGGTLSGNALCMAAARATLDNVLTADAYARMNKLTGRLTDSMNESIARHDVAWHADHLGCRMEYGFQSEPFTNNTEAVGARDAALSKFMHLHALNRGVLVVPFHCHAQVSAAASEADVDRYATVFDEALADLTGR